MRVSFLKYKLNNCSCSIPSIKIGGQKGIERTYCALVNQVTTIVIVFLFSTAVFAGVGTDSLQFLKIRPSARAASIGDGFVGLADDSNASFYNPAGLASLRTPEISLMHLSYIGETGYEYVTGLLPAGKDFTLGAYIIYLNYGSITKTTEDSSGIYSGTNGAFTPYNLAGGVSVGYRLNESLNVGVGIKYASEDIDGSSVSGIMADVGVLCNLEGTGVGISISNIGGNIGADKSPMLMRMGVSTKFSVLADDDLTAVLGGNYVLASGKTVESAGAEYCYDSFASVRGSFSIGDDSNNINLGAGVKQNIEGMTCGLDYNFSLFGDLGSAHRISLTVKFGEEDGSYKGKKKGASVKSSTTKTNNSSNGSTLKYYFKKK